MKLLAVMMVMSVGFVSNNAEAAYSAPKKSSYQICQENKARACASFFSNKRNAGKICPNDRTFCK